MDTKSSKCVHLVEGGTNGSQDVNMAPMGKTSLGRVIHARKRQKTSFTNLETHGDGSGYLACDTCSSGVPNEIIPAGIVPIGNIPVGNNIGFQTRTKGRVGGSCGTSLLCPCCGTFACRRGAFPPGARRVAAPTGQAWMCGLPSPAPPSPPVPCPPVHRPQPRRTGAPIR